jgi:iron-sulfur cluster assembly protein
MVGRGDLTVEIPQARTAQIVIPLPAAALPVSLSEPAARHFANQLASRPGAAAVRLSVEPAGCSGFSYRVAHAAAIRDDDTVFESRGIRIAVDPASLPRIQGTTLDLAQAGLSRRLRFENPNARQTCGCGESFGT